MFWCSKHGEYSPDTSGSCPACRSEWTQTVRTTPTAEEAARDRITALEAEVERLKAERDAILREARCWAFEAKTQKATVNEVGSVLDGIPDWGPIAKRVREMKSRLSRAEAVVAAATVLTESLSEFVHNFPGEFRTRSGVVLTQAVDKLRDALAAHEEEQDDARA